MNLIWRLRKLAIRCFFIDRRNEKRTIAVYACVLLVLVVLNVAIFSYLLRVFRQIDFSDQLEAMKEEEGKASLLNEEFKRHAEPKRTVKIFCVVTTSKSTLIEQGLTVWRTWAQKCDRALFVCPDCDYRRELESRNWLYRLLKFFNVHLTVHKHRELMPLTWVPMVNNKDFVESLSSVQQESSRASHRQYSWFLFAHDDTFVITNNLYKFCQSSHESKDSYFALNETRPYRSESSKWAELERLRDKVGGGVLMNRMSFETLVKTTLKRYCSSTRETFDESLENCLRASNLKQEASLDSTGKSLFNNDHPMNMLFETARDAKSRFKIKGDYRYDCCGNETISFHRLDRMNLLMMNFFERIYSNKNSNKGRV